MALSEKPKLCIDTAPPEPLGSRYKPQAIPVQQSTEIEVDVSRHPTLSFRGIVKDSRGRIPGYVPYDRALYGDGATYMDYEAQPIDPNEAVLERMFETGMYERWWRYGHFGKRQNIADQIIPSSRFNRLKKWLSCDRGSNSSDSSSTRDLTVGKQETGWEYKVVPEIKMHWAEAYRDFADPKRMGYLALATRKQRPLVLNNSRGSRPPPYSAPAVPGGEWARENAYSDNTRIRLLFKYIWIFTFVEGRKCIAKPVKHGVGNVTTIGTARNVLLTKERDVMMSLWSSDFHGDAIAVWPPVEFLD